MVEVPALLNIQAGRKAQDLKTLSRSSSPLSSAPPSDNKDHADQDEQVMPNGGGSSSIRRPRIGSRKVELGEPFEDDSPPSTPPDPGRSRSVQLNSPVAGRNPTKIQQPRSTDDPSAVPPAFPVQTKGSRRPAKRSSALKVEVVALPRQAGSGEDFNPEREAERKGSCRSSTAGHAKGKKRSAGPSAEMSKKLDTVPKEQMRQSGPTQPAAQDNSKVVPHAETSVPSQPPKRKRIQSPHETKKVDSLPSAVPMSEDPEPTTQKTASFTSPAIPSSKFARVLRLVAALGSPHAGISPPPKVNRPRPPVWAESRQELCEALPYYRAFQAGLYMCNRVAYGYLLEAFPAPRDIWADNGRIVISHGGGQCIRTADQHGRKGNPALAADQSASDARIDTLLHAHHNRTPLILLAGEGYENLPWKLGCAYAVLGWYWISAVWVEGEPIAWGVRGPAGRDYFHRYKVRFDWVQCQGVPWWESPVKPIATAPPFSPGGRDIVAVNRPPCSVSSPLSSPPVSPVQRSKKDRKHQALQIGLPTPPVTPPEKSYRTFSIVPQPHVLSSSLTGTEEQSAGLSEHDESIPRTEDRIDFDHSKPPSRKRNYPGEGLLQDQVATVTSEEYMPPFLSISTSCLTCRKPSPQIYTEGWICCNPACAQFWLLSTIIGLMPIPPGFSLTYSEKWLVAASSPPGMDAVPYDIRPPPPAAALSEAGSAGDRTLWKGWVCDCGRANCRYRWEVWECRSCGRQMAPLDPERIVLAADLLHGPASFLGDAMVHPDARINVTMPVLGREGCLVVSYSLPRDGGTIYHLMPSDKAPANAVWEEYQRAAAGTRKPLFERRALKGGTVKGQLLAQHFAVNSGVQYKYNVETASLTFDESPACINTARQMIQDAVQAVLPGAPVHFNEVLSVMYREGQKMNWHDDGEEGLGPIVASLSLGSTATMEWRPKMDRSEANMSYYHGRGPENKRTRTRTPPTALSLTLSHGDVIIMEGEKIQMRYSHRVVPHGFRVAATAREIGGGGAE